MSGSILIELIDGMKSIMDTFYIYILFVTDSQTSLLPPVVSVHHMVNRHGY